MSQAGLAADLISAGIKTHLQVLDWTATHLFECCTHLQPLRPATACPQRRHIRQRIGTATGCGDRLRGAAEVHAAHNALQMMLAMHVGSNCKCSGGEFENISRVFVSEFSDISTHHHITPCQVQLVVATNSSAQLAQHEVRFIVSGCSAAVAIASAKVQHAAVRRRRAAGSAPLAASTHPKLALATSPCFEA